MAASPEIYCNLNMYEANPPTSSFESSDQAFLNKPNMITFELHMIQRYQLRLQLPQRSDIVIIEDIESPEFCAVLNVPISVVVTSPSFRKVYVSGELKSLNLDPTVTEYLTDRIESWVLADVEKSGVWEGFYVVAEVGVFKVDVVDKDEADKIACSVFQTDGVDFSGLVEENLSLDLSLEWS